MYHMIVKYTLPTESGLPGFTYNRKGPTHVAVQLINQILKAALRMRIIFKVFRKTQVYHNTLLRYTFPNVSSRYICLQVQFRSILYLLNSLKTYHSQIYVTFQLGERVPPNQFTDKKEPKACNLENEQAIVRRDCWLLLSPALYAQLPFSDSTNSLQSSDPANVQGPPPTALGFFLL